LKTYSLEFHVEALKEWNELDGSIKEQFKKVIAKRQQNPHVPKARLSQELHNCYKIKLQAAGYRLVYEVVNNKLIIIVLAVGRRSEFEVYKNATKRR
jgi:mRNA interferase RelE/StbE